MLQSSRTPRVRSGLSAIGAQRGPGARGVERVAGMVGRACVSGEGAIRQVWAKGARRSCRATDHFDWLGERMQMRISSVLLWRVLVATVLAVLVVFVAMSARALASEPVAGDVVSGGLGGGGLMEAPQAAAGEAAGLSSPEALAEDARSRSEFAGYGRDQAVALAKRVFGLGSSSGGMPGQGAGKVAYLGEDAAAETLPDGQHLLLESGMPLRSAVGLGHLAPVSLSLNEGGSSFSPSNPLVPVVISKSVAEGVSFQFGLRVAPVQHEAPEFSELVGNSVFYPGTAKDTDFLLEPALGGVDASWQLLSAESASEDALSFALPAGASLVLSQRIKGAAEVLLEGRRLFVIMPASATQADGESLPVSYSVSGSTLVTHVDLSGDVAFPVMVDPLITQEYGGSSGFWAGWNEAGTTGAYFEGGQGNMGVLAGLLPNYGSGAWAAQSIFAPGWSAEEGAVTRVDVRGLLHDFGSDSMLETGIEGGQATKPIWTYNGTNPAETREGQLKTGEQFSGRAAAFCAASGGGYDGGSLPLCNENFGGNYYHLSIYAREAKSYNRFVVIENTWVKFIDTSKISASFSANATTAGGYTNALANGETWFGPASKTRIEYSASDPSFGVASLSLQRWTGGSWETIYSNNYQTEGGCSGVQCGPERSIELSYKNLEGHLLDGEDKLRVLARDPAGVEKLSAEETLLVDSIPPHELKVSAADVKGETVNITEGQAGNGITVSATDGQSGVPGSGIKQLGIEVDKHQIGGYEGSCTHTPCTATASWTLNGRELGAGTHTLIITATDNAGNIESKSYLLIVHAAAPVAMGPGSVNPESGDFALESADVNLKDADGELAITRHYDSRNVNEGAEGSLGPQWTLGLGQLASLEVVESEGKTEGVMVIGAEGLSFFAAKEGGGFEPPPGDSSLSLTLITGGTEYVLEDKKKGTSTTFTRPMGAKQWMPTISKTTVATDTLTDSYKSVSMEGKTVVEPTEELGPHGKATCPSERKKLLADEEKEAEACRALFFYYGEEEATQAEATGENQSQWGWYPNRLSRVVSVVWNTSVGKMEEVAVAEYSYDKQGRLRAEWDPRIKPALKATYGYDSEGHVTAVSAPGKQPWLMIYGTAGEDASFGRLVKVTRPAASTALWAGLVPESTEVPVISGTAGTGDRLAVSEGKWSHSPLVYGFQWERCNHSGAGCVPIAGATNANYTPGVLDLEHTLVVKVTATNAGGSTTVTSAVSGEVFLSAAGGYVNVQQSVDSSSITAVSCLPATTDCVLADSKGSVQYATNLSASRPANWITWNGPGASPSEAVTCPSSGLCLLAAGSHEGGGSLYYATSLGGSWNEAYTPTYGVNAVSCVSASLCVAGQGAGFLRESTKPASTSWGVVSQGSAAMSASTCLSSSFCVVADKAGNVHVAPSKSSIESNTWTQTNVDGSTALTSVACLSTSSCLAVDGAGNQLALAINSSGSVTSTTKSDIDGSNALTGISCPTSTLCAAVDSHGNLLVSTNGGGSWSKPEELGGDLTSVSCASKTLCLTASTSGLVIAFNPSEEAVQGSQQTPQPGSTIEYDVPVSGSSAPYGMGSKEVEKWGQKDDPAEASEIFPPEHAQQWPATEKTGASVYYADDEAKTVNVAAPNGAISTAEYQEGEVVRALTADNRQKALGEANPVEAAEKLSTKSKYNSQNNELIEVTGPEHKVKLSNGEEVNARNHVHYYYDEGAPENSKGEPEEKGLVTRTTDGALLSNGEEKDVRTTLTGYSGQEGLGWTLQAPTSTTTEPSGADLITSTIYNKETGHVEETRSPAGNAETVSPPVFSSAFGEPGSGNGQFKDASAVAISPYGETWVYDRGDGRVEKFSSNNSFLGAYESKLGKFSGTGGVAVSPKTLNVFVSDSERHRMVELGSNGQELRQFSVTALVKPTGIYVTPAGEVFVADASANKVEEFSEEGTYIESFGGEHLQEPSDVAIENGVMYVTGAHSVMMFTLKNEYLGSFGSRGNQSGQFETPTAIAVEPGTGDLLVADDGNERVEEFNPAGKFLTEFGAAGSKNGQFSGIAGVAISSITGKIYTSETVGDRVQEFVPPEAGGARTVYSTQWGKHGSGAGEFLYDGDVAITSTGNVLVTDYEADDVQKFTPQGKYLTTFGSKGTGNGQFEGPAGLAVNQSNSNAYIADCGNNRIQELKANGEFVRAFGSEQLSCPSAVALDSSGNVWVTDIGKNRIVEYSATGSYIAAFGSIGTGQVQFKEPIDLQVIGSYVYIADAGNNRVEILNLKGEYQGQIGSEGNDGGQFKRPEGLAFNSASDTFVLDSGNNRIEEFNPQGHYMQSIATHGVGEGQLAAPQGIAVTAAGDIYVTDAGNHRVEKWIPDSQAVHDTKTIYYTAGSEAGVEACDNRPQWAGLACRTEPAAQPTDSSASPKGEELPQLPVITTEYNMWYEPVKTTEAYGSTSRTKTTTYEAERPVQQTIEAGAGKPVAPVTDKYSTTLGMLIEQTSEGKTISRQLNTLGELESYTDSEGSATTYTYDQYARLIEVDYNASKLDHMEAKQRLHYEETTGTLTELEDLGGEGTYKEQGAGTFKANYGPEGEITSETYPNNMTATYSYNSIGEGTSLTYKKNNHCTGSECEWFTDNLTPSIHGETLTQESSLAKNQYRYEQPGRLAEVKETPTGKNCIARIYATNEEGDRTTLTTRKSSTSECTEAEGGEVKRYTYDEANRPTDEGTQYEPLGNITKLPAADAGGHILETEYYADSQARSQTQNETINTYLLDPESRTRVTETTAKLAATTTIAHYPGPGGSVPSWTYNQTAASWTRNIASFGGLAATEESGKQAVLQLRDLQGNIIGTASLSETTGKLLTVERTTEYGVPISEKPVDKYNWLGASGLTPSLASGSIVQDGNTYIPQLGAPLQTQTTPEPATVNTVAPFTITVTPFTPAAYIEAQSKTKETGTPNGNVPEPEGESGVGGDPVAHIANSVTKCRLWIRFGEAHPSFMLAVGGFKCTRAVPAFELQVCILHQKKLNTGPWSDLECNHNKEGKTGQSWKNVNTWQGWVETECADGIGYRGWAWGREFSDGKTVAAPYAIETKSVTCGGGSVGSHDEVGEDAVEWFIPSLPLFPD